MQLCEQKKLTVTQPHNEQILQLITANFLTHTQILMHLLQKNNRTNNYEITKMRLPIVTVAMQKYSQSLLNSFVTAVTVNFSLCMK